MSSFSLYDTLASVIPKELALPSYLFSFESGVTPLSTWKEVGIAMFTYFLVIFSGRELMKKLPAFKLQFLFQCHNLFLSTGSALLLILMVQEIAPIVYNHGFWYAICNPAAFTEKLEFYYIINYYIKYYELLDTVFLVLKKKNLAFLHVFHHSATAVLCFTQLQGTTSVQWVVITINLLVHVIMYYYYFATAGGKKLWWKKYLTTMQITQFIIDIFIIYIASYGHFVHAYGAGRLPNIGDCAGSEGAALFGCALISSYLFLFIGFYRATYKATAAAKEKRGGKGSKVIREGKNGSAIVTEK
ncbi:fatty acid elongase [Mrakia frigida]|uniref:elongation of very long chain fatty acids protein n=1 Tax=Mrakia frigida TaxID=29902 RepID=UPI003FCBEF70